MVSLILPNRNNEPVLPLFLEKLERHTAGQDFELIVVDDGSTDRSVAVLERWRASGRFRSFTLITKPPTGIVDTLNLALERAAGDVVVRLDGDATIESPGWLQRMLALLESDPRVGVVTGRTVFEDGRVHSYGLNIVGPEGVHDRGTRITEPVGRRTLDLNVERPMDRDCADGRAPAEIDSAGGCCMMFRRELAAELGGFDTNYSPVWVEDYDFALGARRLGTKVFYLPDVEIVHRVSLRNPRHDASLRERMLVRLRRRVGHLVPRRVRAATAAAAGLGHHDPRHVAQLHRHYAYWERKWGWDPLNPDMERLLARWGETEVCWRYDEARRAAGEAIIASASRPPSRPSAG